MTASTSITRITFACLLGLLGMMLNITSVQSHELPENRATMVLRDDTHLSLTFYVDYPDVLQAVLAPKKSHREFLLACAAMTIDDFRKQILLVQTRLQTETRVVLNGVNGAKGAVINGWVWPDAARVQAAIQQEVMALMAGNAANTYAHAHEEPTEIRANITQIAPIKSASIEFADAFGKMLLVSYRPQQIWVAPQQASPLINF